MDINKRDQLDEDGYYRRNLARLMAQYPESEDETRDSKFKRWLGDSLDWAIGRYNAGEYPEAMRGLLQVREYYGIVGYWPDPVAHDAAIALQNALEARLRGRT